MVELPSPIRKRTKLSRLWGRRAADESRVWFAASSLVIAIGISVSVLGVVFCYGLSGFWPRGIQPYPRGMSADGRVLLGFAETGRVRKLANGADADDWVYEEQLASQLPQTGLMAAELLGGIREVGVAYSLVETVDWEKTVHFKVAEYLGIVQSVESKRPGFGRLQDSEVAAIGAWVQQGQLRFANEFVEAQALPGGSGIPCGWQEGRWQFLSENQDVGTPSLSRPIAIKWFGPRAIERRIEASIRAESRRGSAMSQLVTQIAEQESLVIELVRQATFREEVQFGEILDALLEAFSVVEECSRGLELVGEVRTEAETAAELLALPRSSQIWKELQSEANSRAARELREFLKTIDNRRQSEAETTKTVRLQRIETAFRKYVQLERQRRGLERQGCDATLGFSDSLTISSVAAGMATDAIASPESSIQSEQEATLVQDDSGAEWVFRVAPYEPGMTIRGPVGEQRSTAETSWVAISDGVQEVSLRELRRAYFPASVSSWHRGRIFLARWRDFLIARQVNKPGGGMFEAIGGTIILTLLMTIAVVPLGVVAAVYLHEYTIGGPFVSLIRISIHNLAGVPSIVYGVFGVAFFCYLMGAYIDGGPTNAGFAALPPLQWYLLIFATAVAGLLAVIASVRFVSAPSDSNRNWALLALLLWIAGGIGVVGTLFFNPFFEGFFSERLPSPTFGKGGIIWAALTLALLTLPTVIVATEEALAAVPDSFRVASAACGATRWQTIQFVALPNATYGILTGTILSMSRAIGQVAPLMLVGALPVAAELAVDAEPPFLHGSRGFMHVGYQVYNLGLQSSSSYELRPHVYAAILLLVLCVTFLNLLASRLRKRAIALSDFAREI